MSYSHDNTLLQRMGFRDPDRKSPIHDRACIEVATSPQLVLDKLGIRYDAVRATIEDPIQKGEGKYSTTIGFIDAFVVWMNKKLWPECRSPHPEGQPRVRCPACTDYIEKVYGALLVEVKTHIDNIGDLLRQMNLYRQYKTLHDTGTYGPHGRYARVDPYVIWSLDRADHQYAPLLTRQGYKLMIGPALATAEVIQVETQQQDDPW